MPQLVGRTIIPTIMIITCNALLSCSPYVYSSDVAKLSMQTSSVDASGQQIERAIADQQYQNNRYDWIQKQGTALAPGPGCGLNYTGSVACELVRSPAASPLKDPPNAAPSARSADVCEMATTATPVNAVPSQTTKKPSTSAEIAGLLKALDNYTAALAAITNAQDRADFDTAASELSAAVAALAQSGGPYGAAAAPIAKASVNIALWFVGEALDHQRLDALRNSTRAACQPIHVVTDALGLALDDRRRTLLGADYKWLIDMVGRYNRDRTNLRASDQTLGTDIDNAQAAAAKLETVRVSNPTATMRALSDAHDALVVAVRNNDGEFGALATSLQMLTTQAQALNAAVTSPAKTS